MARHPVVGDELLYRLHVNFVRLLELHQLGVVAVQIFLRAFLRRVFEQTDWQFTITTSRLRNLLAVAIVFSEPRVTESVATYCRVR